MRGGELIAGDELPGDEARGGAGDVDGVEDAAIGAVAGGEGDLVAEVLLVGIEEELDGGGLAVALGLLDGGGDHGGQLVLAADAGDVAIADEGIGGVEGAGAGDAVEAGVGLGGADGDAEEDGEAAVADLDGRAADLAEAFDGGGVGVGDEQGAELVVLEEARRRIAAGHGDVRAGVADEDDLCGADAGAAGAGDDPARGGPGIERIEVGLVALEDALGGLGAQPLPLLAHVDHGEGVGVGGVGGERGVDLVVAEDGGDAAELLLARAAALVAGGDLVELGARGGGAGGEVRIGGGAGEGVELAAQRIDRLLGRHVAGRAGDALGGEAAGDDGGAADLDGDVRRAVARRDVHEHAPVGQDLEAGGAVDDGAGGGELVLPGADGGEGDALVGAGELEGIADAGGAEVTELGGGLGDVLAGIDLPAAAIVDEEAVGIARGEGGAAADLRAVDDGVLAGGQGLSLAAQIFDGGGGDLGAAGLGDVGELGGALARDALGLGGLGPGDERLALALALGGGPLIGVGLGLHGGEVGAQLGGQGLGALAEAVELGAGAVAEHRLDEGAALGGAGGAVAQAEVIDQGEQLALGGRARGGGRLGEQVGLGEAAAVVGAELGVGGQRAAGERVGGGDAVVAGELALGEDLGELVAEGALDVGGVDGVGELDDVAALHGDVLGGRRVGGVGDGGEPFLRRIDDGAGDQVALEGPRADAHRQGRAVIEVDDVGVRGAGAIDARDAAQPRGGGVHGGVGAGLDGGRVGGAGAALEAGAGDGARGDVAGERGGVGLDRRGADRRVAHRGGVARGGRVTHGRGGARRGRVARGRGVARGGGVAHGREVARGGGVAHGRGVARGRRVTHGRGVAPHGRGVARGGRVAHGREVARGGRVAHGEVARGRRAVRPTGRCALDGDRRQPVAVAARKPAVDPFDPAVDALADDRHAPAHRDVLGGEVLEEGLLRLGQRLLVGEVARPRIEVAGGRRRAAAAVQIGAGLDHRLGGGAQQRAHRRARDSRRRGRARDRQDRRAPRGRIGHALFPRILGLGARLFPGGAVAARVEADVHRLRAARRDDVHRHVDDRADDGVADDLPHRRIGGDLAHHAVGHRRAAQAAHRAEARGDRALGRRDGAFVHRHLADLFVRLAGAGDPPLGVGAQRRVVEVRQRPLHRLGDLFALLRRHARQIGLPIGADLELAVARHVDALAAIGHRDGALPRHCIPCQRDPAGERPADHAGQQHRRDRPAHAAGADGDRHRHDGGEADDDRVAPRPVPEVGEALEERRRQQIDERARPDADQLAELADRALGAVDGAIDLRLDLLELLLLLREVAVGGGDRAIEGPIDPGLGLLVRALDRGGAALIGLLDLLVQPRLHLGDGGVQLLLGAIDRRHRGGGRALDVLLQLLAGGLDLLLQLLGRPVEVVAVLLRGLLQLAAEVLVDRRDGAHQRIEDAVDRLLEGRHQLAQHLGERGDQLLQRPRQRGDGLADQVGDRRNDRADGRGRRLDGALDELLDRVERVERGLAGSVEHGGGGGPRRLEDRHHGGPARVEDGLRRGEQLADPRLHPVERVADQPLGLLRLRLGLLGRRRRLAAGALLRRLGLSLVDLGGVIRLALLRDLVDLLLALGVELRGLRLQLLLALLDLPFAVGLEPLLLGLAALVLRGHLLLVLRLGLRLLRLVLGLGLGLLRFALGLGLGLALLRGGLRLRLRLHLALLGGLVLRLEAGLRALLLGGVARLAGGVRRQLRALRRLHAGVARHLRRLHAGLRGGLRGGHAGRHRGVGGAGDLLAGAPVLRGLGADLRGGDRRRARLDLRLLGLRLLRRLGQLPLLVLARPIGVRLIAVGQGGAGGRQLRRALRLCLRRDGGLDLGDGGGAGARTRARLASARAAGVGPGLRRPRGRSRGGLGLLAEGATRHLQLRGPDRAQRIEPGPLPRLLDAQGGERALGGGRRQLRQRAGRVETLERPRIERTELGAAGDLRDLGGAVELERGHRRGAAGALHQLLALLRRARRSGGPGPVGGHRDPRGRLLRHRLAVRLRADAIAILQRQSIGGDLGGARASGGVRGRGLLVRRGGEPLPRRHLDHRHLALALRSQRHHLAGALRAGLDRQLVLQPLLLAERALRVLPIAAEIDLRLQLGRIGDPGARPQRRRRGRGRRGRGRRAGLGRLIEERGDLRHRLRGRAGQLRRRQRQRAGQRGLRQRLARQVQLGQARRGVALGDRRGHRQGLDLGVGGGGPRPGGHGASGGARQRDEGRRRRGLARGLRAKVARAVRDVSSLERARRRRGRQVARRQRRRRRWRLAVTAQLQRGLGHRARRQHHLGQRDLRKRRLRGARLNRPG